jgi:predicted nucleic acid-binding Zn ribbon protein
VDDDLRHPADEARSAPNHRHSVSDPAQNVTDAQGGADGGDLTRSALANARGIVRRSPRGSAAGRRTRRDNLAGRRRGAGERNRGGFSGPGPDPERDPHLVGPLLAGYLAERGWDAELAHARVFAEWPALVGADVAAHCRPESLHEGQLRIAAESTAWATQLRLLSSTLLARLVAELGPGVVAGLHITGPVGPSWRHGTWSVRGSRGPRDTYG